MPKLSSTARPGFLSVEEAAAIIEKHTPTEPTVALDRLVKGVRYLKAGNNYTLFLMKRVGSRLVSCGSKPIDVVTEYDAVSLKALIGEKFREAVGRDLTPENATRTMSSVIEPNNTGGRPVRGKTITPAGQQIGRAVSTDGATSLGASSPLLDGIRQ